MRSPRPWGVLVFYLASGCGGSGPTAPGPIARAVVSREAEGMEATLVGDAGGARYIDGKAVWGGRPRLVFVDDARPVLVWTSEEPRGTRIWSARAQSDRSWSAPEAAPIDLPGTSTRLEAVADGAGGAVVAALQIEGDRYAAWFLRVDPRGRPGLPAPLAPVDPRAWFSLSRDEGGAPLVAWATWARGAVWVSRLTREAWSAPELIASDTSGTGVFGAQALSNGRGSLVVTWYQDLSSRRPRVALASSRWTPAGWTTPRWLSGSVWGILELNAEMGREGHARLTWETDYGGNLGTTSLLIPPQGEPVGAAVAGTSAGSITSLGVDAAGNGVALWHRSPPAGAASLWASRALSTSWTERRRIETHEGAFVPVEPQLGVDDDGQAIAAWREELEVWINDMSREGEWGTARRVDGDRLGDALAHHVAMKDGVGWIAWSAHDGARVRMWAVRVATVPPR